MTIKLKEITVRKLFNGYEDRDENGVFGYGGLLDIRPSFRREFIYKEKQREAVINTIIKGFPLNVMYWADSEDDTFEIIDGQQRTISICQYFQGDFSFNQRYFCTLIWHEIKKNLYFCPPYS
ncbi:MAG: DUF262 domain-containing protein [Tannerella sp.]|nr:DUF262 domain-containing protein [Tannerella sp.]